MNQALPPFEGLIKQVLLACLPISFEVQLETVDYLRIRVKQLQVGR